MAITVKELREILNGFPPETLLLAAMPNVDKYGDDYVGSEFTANISITKVHVTESSASGFYDAHCSFSVPDGRDIIPALVIENLAE